MIILHSRDDKSTISLSLRDTIILPKNREDFITCDIYCSFTSNVVKQEPRNLLSTIIELYPGYTIFYGNDKYYVKESELKLYVNEWQSLLSDELYMFAPFSVIPNF